MKKLTVPLKKPKSLLFYLKGKRRLPFDIEKQAFGVHWHELWITYIKNIFTTLRFFFAIYVTSSHFFRRFNISATVQFGETQIRFFSFRMQKKTFNWQWETFNWHWEIGNWSLIWIVYVKYIFITFFKSFLLFDIWKLLLISFGLSFERLFGLEKLSDLEKLKCNVVNIAFLLFNIWNILFFSFVLSFKRLFGIDDTKTEFFDIEN